MTGLGNTEGHERFEVPALFTGIVETTARIADLQPSTAGQLLVLDHAPFDPAIRHGDSVAVSGVCLTATDPQARQCSFDVIPETLRRTILGDLRPGDHVNIERSMTPVSRFDGHFVQGHVDATGAVERIDADAGEHLVWIRFPAELAPLVIPKGSIAIDGVSLTIAAVEGGCFSVALIPTTLDRTTLGRLQPGGRVNLESDIIARAIHHQLSQLTGTGDAGDLMGLLNRSGFA